MSENYERTVQYVSRPADVVSSAASASSHVAARPCRGQDKSAAIVIIASEFLIRDCLAQCLSASGEAAIQVVTGVDDWIAAGSSQPPPSLIILCILGRKHEEIERNLSALASLRGTAPVVLMSDHTDADHIRAAFAWGARGVIPTNLPLDVALNAIRLVQVGGTFMPAPLKLVRQPAPDHAAPRFTPRQSSVAAAIRLGKANKQIAYELNLRESTVKVHIRAIMKKLKAKNRTQIAVRINELLRAID